MPFGRYAVSPISPEYRSLYHHLAPFWLFLAWIGYLFLVIHKPTAEGLLQVGSLELQVAPTFLGSAAHL